MKLDLSGKWQIGDGTLIFKVDDKLNTSSVVTGAADIASVVALQQMQTGSVTLTFPNGTVNNHTWMSDGIFLTIYNLDGKINSQWVLYGKKLVMFVPWMTEIVKVQSAQGMA